MKSLVLLVLTLALYAVVQTWLGRREGEDLRVSVENNATVVLVVLVVLVPVALVVDVLFGAPYRLHCRSGAAHKAVARERDELARQITDLRETEPQIDAPEIVGPELFDGGRYQVIQLHFFNRGERSKGADRVTVEVSYSREGSTDLPDAVKSQWIGLTTDPNDMGPLDQTVQEINLPRSHIPRKLPIAIRFTGQDDAHVWSSWKYVNAAYGRIGPGRYLLCVHLVGPNLDRKFWYTLENGADFSLTERPDSTQVAE